MASKNGQTNTIVNIGIDQNKQLSLNNNLIKEHSLCFFQSVRLLLRSSLNSIKPGQAGPISKEVLLFKANPSLAFPVRDVEEIEIDKKSKKNIPSISMTVNFLGLYGPSSPIPDHYTEEILFGDKVDSCSRLFLDIFNHRYISFFYRAWEKYRYSLQFKTDATDQMSQWMLSFIGLHNQELKQYSNLDWQRLIPLTGLLSMRNGSAWVLRQVISIYFSLSVVSIEENIEIQTAIDDLQLNKLGCKNTRLDMDISLGDTIKNCAGKFRVCIGQLSLADYQSFLAGGKNEKALRELVLLTIGDPLEFETVLTLRKDEQPDCVVLSNTNKKDNIEKYKDIKEKSIEVQLGINTWL